MSNKVSFESIIEESLVSENVSPTKKFVKELTNQILSRIYDNLGDGNKISFKHIGVLSRKKSGYAEGKYRLSVKSSQRIK